MRMPESALFPPRLKYNRFIEMNDNPQLDAPMPPENTSAVARGADTFDDMHDSAEEISRYEPIAGTLQLCRRIADEFDQADNYAVKFQRLHRWLTSAAAFL